MAKTIKIVGAGISEEAANALIIEAIEKAKAEMRLEILKAENPVGHLRLELTNTNPSTYLGFGTWVLWGAGKVPVGIDSADTDFNIAEKTGGEKVHRHFTDPLWVEKDGKYYIGFSNNQGIAPSALIPVSYAKSYYGNEVELKATTANEKGMCMYGCLEESSLQPYITCYMWKRTA